MQRIWNQNWDKILWNWPKFQKLRKTETETSNLIFLPIHRKKNDCPLYIYDITYGSPKIIMQTMHAAWQTSNWVWWTCIKPLRTLNWILQEINYPNSFKELIKDFGQRTNVLVWEAELGYTDQIQYNVRFQTR